MFKLPTLTKLPQPRRFNYEPRHYDPEKEAIKQRIAEAKARANKTAENYSSEHALRGAIRRHSRLRQKTTDLSQLIFVVGFGSIAFLYFEYGKDALWAFVVLILGYVWYKIRK
ncbi:MAG: hypothetical protein RMJ87_09015 [Cytophagales bacterium]|nr:hypothetical protein [Bernardetiaceae bacterium]MDW8205154.1 hypothetical protein [Cytophagales bacterium]